MKLLLTTSNRFKFLEFPARKRKRTQWRKSYSNLCKWANLVFHRWPYIEANLHHLCFSVHDNRRRGKYRQFNFEEKIASQPTLLPADLIEAEHLQIWFIYGPACFFYSNFADIRTNRKIVNFDLIHFSVCFVMQLCNNSELWHCQQGWGVWLLTIQIWAS